jgi:putative ATPase
VNLFDHSLASQLERESPLAHRMRPRSLDEFVGQEHIVGPGRLLRRAIQADQLSSILFCGPPGTGKTTLAAVIANHTRSHFATINAVLAGVQSIREAIDAALERRKLHAQRTTLFVDEVHRWNKAQQDALLPHVENGTIILIGATTENPYFEVNKALVSRSRVFQLRPLTADHLRQIARRALDDPERGYGKKRVRVDPAAMDHLVDVASGDARGVLNALELAVETTPPGPDGTIVVDLTVAEESIQRRAVLYDKDGDVHFDTISAFIKSLRGSDPDAALYWMARMVYAGEDPRFIFRRMAILASEDVGLAAPEVAGVVAGCWELFERVGMPEGRFHLAQAALALATCPKSNSTMGFFDALAAVEREAEGEVPVHLKDANRDQEGFGHGQGYLYPHAYRDHWVAQQYLPAGLQGRLFYQPGDQGHERTLRDQVERRREAQLAAMLESVAGETTEILTTGPANRARDAWLARTSAAAAAAAAPGGLDAVRDRLVERARLARHHVVLVVSESSGLLTWESLRRAPEGGVWVAARDPGIAAVIRDRAARLPELERPRVLECAAAADLPARLALESAPRFDRILVCNAFTRGGDASALAVLARDWLAPGGEIDMAQVVPRRGQRLHALVRFPAGDEALRDRTAAAEEALHARPGDPLTGWDVADLVAPLPGVAPGSGPAGPAGGLRPPSGAPGSGPAGPAGGLRPPSGAPSRVESHLESITTQRLVSRRELEAWLSRDERPPGSGSGLRPPSGDRASYARRLIELGVSEDDLARLAALYRDQLAGRTVSWTTAVLFVTIAPASSAG